MSSILFMFSCSNDNNSTANEISIKNFRVLNIENEIDEMFYEYVNSQEFIDFNNASNDFYYKLNLIDEQIEEIDFSDIISWIAINISSTRFVSIEEAENEWENLITLKGVELHKFPQVVDFVVSADNADVRFYFDKWIFEPTQTTTNNEECEEEFDICNKAADDNYFGQVTQILNESAGKVRNSLMSQASQAYIRNLVFCANNFNTCLGI